MKTHKIPGQDFDLEETLTCGQTFCWHRIDGELYEDGQTHFYTFRNDKPIIVEQKEDGSIIAKTELPIEEVKKALGLDKDLKAIFETFPEDEILEKAKKELWGLRIIQDEPFPCLISYLCSPQMQIPRIKQMHNEISREYGEIQTVEGLKLLKFPTIEALGKASEDELRDLGVGYRAKYIAESTEMLVKKEVQLEDIRDKDYKNAKKEIKKLYGVGDKVADCVLLFSFGFIEAYPVDTWAEKVIKKHYPDLYSEDYEQLSENVREYFGEYSGYAQEYLFHAARKGVIEVE